MNASLGAWYLNLCRVPCVASITASQRPSSSRVGSADRPVARGGASFRSPIRERS
jgi:hypothetical protein